MGERRNGPAYDTEGGILAPPGVLKCTGCTRLRRHDFHYFFCARDTGQPSYWTDEPVYQLFSGPYPDADCPAKEPTNV